MKNMMFRILHFLVCDLHLWKFSNQTDIYSYIIPLWIQVIIRINRDGIRIQLGKYLLNTYQDPGTVYVLKKQRWIKCGICFQEVRSVSLELQMCKKCFLNGWRRFNRGTKRAWAIVMLHEETTDWVYTDCKCHTEERVTELKEDVDTDNRKLFLSCPVEDEYRFLMQKGQGRIQQIWALASWVSLRTTPLLRKPDLQARSFWNGFVLLKWIRRPFPFGHMKKRLMQTRSGEVEDPKSLKPLPPWKVVMSSLHFTEFLFYTPLTGWSALGDFLLISRSF